VSIRDGVLKILKWWWDKAFYHRSNNFSVDEMRKRLAEYKYYENASYSGVWKALQKLVDEEVIKKEKVKGKNRYCLQYKKLMEVIK
jgi:hypothetical protein